MERAARLITQRPPRADTIFLLMVVKCKESLLARERVVLMKGLPPNRVTFFFLFRRAYVAVNRVPQAKCSRNSELSTKRKREGKNAAAAGAVRGRRCSGGQRM